MVASAGIAMAAFYALRLYQRAMHNSPPPGITSRELGWRDALVLVLLVGVILVLAFTPGTILTRGEASVQDKVGAVAAADDGHLTAGELKSED